MDQRITYFEPDDFQMFIAVCRFIAKCNTEQRTSIVNEVLMLNPMLVFNPDIKSLDSVKSVCVNGDAIQLNLGKCAHDL